MTQTTQIEARIPHRPPFLFVDEILSISSERISTQTVFSKDQAFYQGHYSGNPVTPGVILCEAIFQSGALLMSERSKANPKTTGWPVLTRIQAAKFKKMVFPGDQVEITVRLVEEIGAAVFFKGDLKVGKKTAVQVEFCCAIAPV
jgi:3-hydroxyacyl-[acyl-carrier-protein] dehydratase